MPASCGMVVLIFFFDFFPIWCAMGTSSGGGKYSVLSFGERLDFFFFLFYPCFFVN